MALYDEFTTPSKVNAQIDARLTGQKGEPLGLLQLNSSGKAERNQLPEELLDEDRIDVVDGVAANDTATLNLDTIDDFVDAPRRGRTRFYINDLNRGGSFSFVPDSEGLTPNGGTIFATEGGVAVRNFIGSIYPSWFNTVSDGSTDDSVPIQTMIDYLEVNSGGTVNIDKSINLGGNSFEFPENVILNFNGGSLINGEIIFNNTTLNSPSLVDVNCRGYIKMKNIDDRDFTGGNDTDMLRFFIENVASNNTDLSINRDYTITYTSDIAFVRLENNKGGININWNKNNVYDNYSTITGVRYFIELVKCDNITIADLYYKSNLMSPPDLPESAGVNVVKTEGDCSRIDLINIIGTNVNSVVRCGSYGLGNYVTTGISDSTFLVKGFNIGYTIAVERGVNLRIKAYFDRAHRGFYGGGIEDSSIYLEGKDAITTNVNMMITDTVCYDFDDTDFETPLFKCSKRIDCVSVDTGSVNIFSNTFRIVSSGNANHFAARTNSYNYDGINVKIVNKLPVQHIGIGIFIQPVGSIIDSLTLTVNDSDYYNDSYVFLVYSDNPLLKSSVTLNNVKTNGYISYNPESESSLSILNSIIGNINILKVGSSLLKIQNTKYNSITSLGMSNNVTLQLEGNFVRSSDFRRFLMINNKNNYIETLTDLDITNAVYTKGILVIPSDGGSSYILTGTVNRIGNGEKIELIVKNNKTSSVFLTLSGGSFSGPVFLNNISSVQLLPNDVYQISIMKSNGTVYILTDRLTDFGFRSGTTANRPTIAAGGIGTTYFDNTLGSSLVWNNTKWMGGRAGIYTVNGSGQTSIVIPHGLGVTPTYTNVTAKSADAILAGVVSWTEDSTNITVTITAGAVGTNNLRYSWEARL